MSRIKIHVASHDGVVEVEMETEDKTFDELAELALGVAERLADVVEPTDKS